MQRPIQILLIIALLGLFVGCGGGSQSIQVSNTFGRATFTVTWPKPTRLIPAAANSINVVIYNGTTSVTSQLLARPSSGGTATASFNSLPAGNLTVTATAYPQADGTGVAQATASVPLVIHVAQNTQFSLTMASTINHLTISQPTLTVQSGQSTQLVATAVDASGNVVLTSALNWSSNSTAATVSSTGLVTGVSTGSAQITVTEAESGKSITSAVTVTRAYTSAIAFQGDVGHTGQTSFGTSLIFPKAPAWVVNLGGQISYPVVTGGIVYVTTSTSQLYALNATTGKTVWGPVAVGSPWSGLTYDNGTIFVVNAGGKMSSYNATTGVAGWSVQLPGQYAFSAPPTAANGIVYTGGAGTGGTLYAVSESSGAVLWTASVENGDNSSPAISSDGVFVCYPDQTYKFDLTTGNLLWRYDGPDEGGGGKAPVYANGQLYAREIPFTNITFNAETGAQLGTFSAGPPPVIGATMGYFQTGISYSSDGTLNGVNLASGTVVWSFTGDGQISSAPLAIDNTVFIGSYSGNLYALNGTTGAQLWSINVGAEIYHPDEQNVSQPVTGFAAAEGYLFVPAGNYLTAYNLIGP